MNGKIIVPVITEKSMKLAKNGIYTFAVGKHWTKDLVKKTVEKLFKVNVVHTSIVISKGKTQRTGMKRTEVKLGDTKKTIVKVKKDQKIELFEAQS